MTWSRASTPGPSHSSTGLSKQTHTASHPGREAAEPPSPAALGIYKTWAGPALRQPRVLQALPHKQKLWRWTCGTLDGPRLGPDAKVFLHTPVLYNSGNWTRTVPAFGSSDKWLQSLITNDVHRALRRNGNIFPESWLKLSLIYYILAHNNGIPPCILTECITPH